MARCLAEYVHVPMPEYNPGDGMCFERSIIKTTQSPLHVIFPRRCHVTCIFIFVSNYNNLLHDKCLALNVRLRFWAWITISPSPALHATNKIRLLSAKRLN